MIYLQQSNWRLLHQTAYRLALVMLALIPIQILVFMFSPPPTSVTGFFQLYHDNWFLGLLSLDFLYLFNNAIIAILYLSLFVKLVEERPSLMVMGLVIGLIGIACYFPTNPSFEMWTLSRRYFEANALTQGGIIAAGEGLMAHYTGTSFNSYYVFNAFTLLAFSYAILKSPQFSKATGYWGLASGILMSVPSSFGMVGMIFSLLSLIPWLIFIILLLSRLKKFAAE
jgi:hypothetical protein